MLAYLVRGHNKALDQKKKKKKKKETKPTGVLKNVIQEDRKGCKENNILRAEKERIVQHIFQMYDMCVCLGDAAQNSSTTYDTRYQVRSPRLKQV